MKIAQCSPIILLTNTHLVTVLKQIDPHKFAEIIAGTGVSNITVIRTTIPYAAGAAVIAVVGFLLCGAGVF